jgi:hypothetical protein
MPNDGSSHDPQPTGAYRRTLGDRMGADVGLVYRAAAYAVVAFACFILLFSALSRLEGFSALLIAPLAVVATGGILYVGYRFGALAGGGFLAFLMPTGESTPYEQQFSYQDALAVGGDPGAALRSFESLIATTPIAARDGVELRVRAAEMAIRSGALPRAVELFREVQRMPGVAPSRDLYASNRLIDLFVGPLDEPGRALVELRRLVERFPNTDLASRSRRAIEAMKAPESESH